MEATDNTGKKAPIGLGRKKCLLLFIICISIVILVLAVVPFALMLLYDFETVGESIRYIAETSLSDFGQVIYFTLEDNPYTSSFCTMYTPLNFLFYIPFALICSTNSAFYDLSYWKNYYGTDELSATAAYNYAIFNTWQFWVSLILYYIIIFTLLFFALKKLIAEKKLSDKLLFFFGVLFSTIFAFGIMRGSNIFIVLFFFIMYLNWYDSDKRWKREVALVFLAIAGVMKFYVLFGGVLVLKKKRWLDVLKCAAYSVVLLFLPFVVYDYPLETMMTYISNLVAFGAEEGRIGVLTNISAYNLVYCFFSIFKIQDSMAVTVLCWLALIGVFGVGLFTGLKTKNRFSEYIVICAIFALVSPVLYLYLLSFQVVPLIEFIRERQNFGKRRRIFYYVYFAVMMFLPILFFKFFLVYTALIIAALVIETVVSVKKDSKKIRGGKLIKE